MTRKNYLTIYNVYHTCQNIESFDNIINATLLIDIIFFLLLYIVITYMLEDNGIIKSHVGQIFEKEKKTFSCIRYYNIGHNGQNRHNGKLVRQWL